MCVSVIMTDPEQTEPVQCSESFNDSEQSERLLTQLKKTKLSELKQFQTTVLGQGESEEELLDLLDAMDFQRQGMGYHSAVMLVLIYLVNIPDAMRMKLISNPQQCGEPIPGMWTTLTTCVKFLSQHIRTSWNNLLIGELTNATTANGGTCTTFSFPTELFELKNWLTKFASSCEESMTKRKVGQLYPSTESTSTACTSADKRTRVAGVLGLESPEATSDTEDSEFEKLLDWQSSDSEITETFCNTYAQMTESSKKFMADQKIGDWVIDISIYKYVFEQLLKYYKKIEPSGLDLRRIYLNYIKSGGTMRDKHLLLKNTRVGNLKMIENKYRMNRKQLSRYLGLEQEFKWYLYQNSRDGMCFSHWKTKWDPSVELLSCEDMIQCDRCTFFHRDIYGGSKKQIINSILLNYPLLNKATALNIYYCATGDGRFETCRTRIGGSMSI